MNQKELKIMTEISNSSSKGFPKLLDYGKVHSNGSNIMKTYHNHSFIIMNKLGMSLKDMIIYLKNRFHLVDTLKLGIKLITII